MTTSVSIPTYLQGYESLWEQDPRKAALRWFQDARYGLFLHYGLYSLLGRHEWVQYRDRIRVGEYAALEAFFTAERFDAAYIADLAVDAGMGYICLTTRHHDSFCLWDSAWTRFHSVRAPCGRDLVGELAAACRERGLGLCLYYSHGRDWRHPHAPNNDEYGPMARPPYEPPELTYAYGAAHDLELYLRFMEAQIGELLTHYGPIASIWLDGIATPRAGDPAAFRTEQLYQMIRRMQPQVLVSYKDGLTGTEDYFAPEEEWTFEASQHDKLTETCACLTPGAWGYTADARIRTVDEVWQLLRQNRQNGANLLLNTGPRPDGLIDPAQENVLREVGRRIRNDGFPGEGGKG